ncbi:E3 SUMO-protein ligase KIAA1586-like [Schistocerca gregaria]|uniref:E3 SUMO-protein ligase KIAA1586-like n=1 Tax=Schistocerca gregaria TaxID=7010 RepID=UPI00211EE62E|nr:E3 SUMO-protein ligase KIAA1586-like [Schistocerca gregaria]
MGHNLHFRNACTNIINHIAQEMRKTVIKTIIEAKSNILLLMTDESTTISPLSSLIIYLQTKLLNKAEPTNIFIDIVKLDSVTAEDICNTLLNCLESMGFSKEFLNDNLISIATDRAAVMMGRRIGVVTLMNQHFPQILVWHCANHRLELSVNDVIKRDFPSHVNHFPSVRILGTRWVASSFRIVSAVWKNFKALVAHFTTAEGGQSRESTDRELSELTLELQLRDITLYSAQQKIRNQLLVLEERKLSCGPHYRKALKVVQELNFRRIPLEKGGNYQTF